MDPWMEPIDQRFKSTNEIPVERAFIRAQEWSEIKNRFGLIRAADLLSRAIEERLNNKISDMVSLALRSKASHCHNPAMRGCESCDLADALIKVSRGE